MSVTLIVVVIAVAVYDFTNGFHDAADMVATAIASRAMRPAVAIAIVSVFTLIAPFTIGLDHSQRQALPIGIRGL